MILNDQQHLAVVTLFVVIISTILVLNRKQIGVIYRSYKARSELRRLISQNKTHDDNKDQPYVSGIFIHPVKSLRPVSLSDTTFDEHGLLGDRRLMIVRPLPTPVYGMFVDGEPTHRFFTQRQAPSLATIDASQRYLNSRIKLSSSMIPNESIYINCHPSHIKTLPIRYQCGLWSDQVEVADLGDEAASFVAKIVSKDDDSFRDVRVVSIIPSSRRKVNELYCPGKSARLNLHCLIAFKPHVLTKDLLPFIIINCDAHLPDAARRGLLGKLPQGGLTDGFPILIATQASLDELNRRLAEKGKSELPLSRFRANIIISNTSKPFDEDNWKGIQIGKEKDSVILHIAKGCPRCKQSCTDQLTGERGEEPLETLSEFRALGLDEADVYFGQNAVMNGDVKYHKNMIKVGDSVTVLTRGDPVWDSETVQAE